MERRFMIGSTDAVEALTETGPPGEKLLFPLNRKFKAPLHGFRESAPDSPHTRKVSPRHRRCKQAPDSLNHERFLHFHAAICHASFFHKLGACRGLQLQPVPKPRLRQ